jgi:hypothetical protein
MREIGVLDRRIDRIDHWGSSLTGESMSAHAIGISFTARYPKVAIIQALREHLEAHRADHADALVGYTKKKQKLLREYMREFKKDPKYHPHAIFGLTTPVDASEQYESTIKAFEMAEGDSIELSSAAADAIFNDTWNWASNAKLSNSAYRSS